MLAEKDQAYLFFLMKQVFLLKSRAAETPLPSTTDFTTTTSIRLAAGVGKGRNQGAAALLQHHYCCPCTLGHST